MKFGQPKKIFGRPKKYLVYQKKFGQPKKCEIDRTIGIPKRLTKSTWTSLITLTMRQLQKACMGSILPASHRELLFFLKNEVNQRQETSLLKTSLLKLKPGFL